LGNDAELNTNPLDSIVSQSKGKKSSLKPLIHVGGVNATQPSNNIGTTASNSASKQYIVNDPTNSVKNSSKKSVESLLNTAVKKNTAVLDPLPLTNLYESQIETSDKMQGGGEYVGTASDLKAGQQSMSKRS
jgi:hypothetical protein